MVPDKVNRLLAGRAKKLEVSFAGVQMERMDKSPQRIGHVRLNQALWYLSHGCNLLAIVDYSDKLGKLATQNCRAKSGPFNMAHYVDNAAIPRPQAGCP
jgi:hypothetical protein